MNHFVSLLGGIFLLAVAPQLHAVVYLVNIHGSISSQVFLGPAEGRIETEKLDNTRLFQAFGLSKEDYALVFDTTAGGVRFRQRNSSGALPDVVAFDFGTGSTAIDTRRKVFRLATNIASSAMGNIFEGMSGVGIGSLDYRGDLATLIIKKLSLKVNATGHHSDPSSSTGSVLRFLVKTGPEL